MGIARVFFDCDMRLGIDGLTGHMKKNGFKAAKDDDMMMFVNKAKTNVKIIWDGQYLLQLRKPSDAGKITIGDLTNIPKFFRGQFMAHKYTQQVMAQLSKTIQVKAA